MMKQRKSCFNKAISIITICIYFFQAGTLFASRKKKSGSRLRIKPSEYTLRVYDRDENNIPEAIGIYTEQFREFLSDYNLDGKIDTRVITNDRYKVRLSRKIKGFYQNLKIEVRSRSKKYIALLKLSKNKKKYYLRRLYSEPYQTYYAKETTTDSCAPLN